jgi:DNA-binding response OmpR family regulator
MKRLLVIEDDKTDYESIARMLKPARIDLVWMQNAHEGLRMASDEIFDLVFLDVKVSDMNPWVALRFLNSLHSFLPVIVLAETVNDHLRALTRGADACFGKPIDPAELRKTVKQLLEESHAMRTRRRLHMRTPTRRLDVNFNPGETTFEKNPSECR